MNRLLTRSDSFGISIIPDLQEKRAFELGVEWFAELVFFYALLMGLALVEMKQLEDKRMQQENTINQLKIKGRTQKELLDSFEEEIEKIEQESSRVRDDI